MDREQRLAAAKKKLNIYKQQQQQQQNTQPRRPSIASNEAEPSPPLSSSSSYAGQVSPAIQASSVVNGANGGHHNEHDAMSSNANGGRIAFAHEAPQKPQPQPFAPFPSGAGIESSQPLPPLVFPLPLDGPPQQLDLLDSNSLQPHPTAHFDLLDSNTLPLHSVAQSSPGPGPSSSGAAANAMAGRDIAETHQHQHQRQPSSGSNSGHIINHDIVADINTSYSYNNGNNGNGLMAFANSGPSTLPDVASDAPAPAAVTPGLIEDSQPASPLSQREMEQEMVNIVNQQGQGHSAAPPPDNDLVATATVSAFNHNHNHDHVLHLHAEPSTSASAMARSHPNAGRSPNPINLYPTPTFRRGHQSSGGGSASSSVSGGGLEDSIGAAASAITTEVYELQLSQLRADNVHLQQREADLVAQLQQVEVTIQTLRKERDEFRQELRAEDTPSLKSKLSTVYEENATLKEKVRALELQLEAANENVKIKVDSYNELEQALIVINKGKMELAAKLDVEYEASKELRDRFEESQLQLAKLSERNIELESILSSHQLQLERLSSLEAEMVQMKKGYYSQGTAGGVNHPYEHEHHDHDHHHEDHDHSHSHSHDHEHGAECDHDHHDHNHADAPHEHDHSHGHGHSYNHDDKGHGHHDGHDHDHDHPHAHGEHDHDHHHEDHDHGHSHEHQEGEHEHLHVHATRPPEDPKSLPALEKKLARLEWENSSFREEIDRLAELLRAKTVDANLLTNYQEDNERLKRNLNQAEHLVVQLSSENETIGDYIALYQTQRLALKERAREKENELATLSIEREKLRAQMEQLNQLLQAYHCKLEEGTAGSEVESNAKQINDLVLGINSTFHPCSVCSGSRLMNV